MATNSSVQAVAELIEHGFAVDAEPLAIAGELWDRGLIARPRPVLRGAMVLPRRRQTVGVSATTAAVDAANTAAVVVEALASQARTPVPSVEHTGAMPTTSTEGLAGEHGPVRQVTDLEREALAWDKQCQCADRLAVQLRADYAARPEIRSIERTGDLVDVVLAPEAGLTDWQRWLTGFGCHAQTVQAHGDGGCLVHGQFIGVAVRLSGPGVLEVVAEAARHCEEQAKLRGRPQQYELAGRVYELALPHDDLDGHTWRHRGEFTPLGMPLMVRDDDPSGARCQLDLVVDMAGPVTAVADRPDPHTATVCCARTGCAAREREQYATARGWTYLVSAAAWRCPPHAADRVGDHPTALELVDALLATQEVEQASVVDDTTVDVVLRPQSLQDWAAWMERYAVVIDPAVSWAAAVSGHGRYRGLDLTVLAHGVRQLQDAQGGASA